MITKKTLSIVMLVGLISFSPTMSAQEPESMHWRVTKGIVGGALGAFAGKAYSVMVQYMLGCGSETHEKNMMFLDDLIEYIESPDFIAQHSNDHLFYHYHQELRRYVKETRGADILLLRLFSEKPDEESVERLIAEIKEEQHDLTLRYDFFQKSITACSATIHGAIGALSGAGFIAQDSLYVYACICLGYYVALNQ